MIGIKGRCIFVCIFLFFITPGTIINAQEREGDLAVLNISFTGKELTQHQIDFLSDGLRGVAVKLTNYRIMNKESIFAILADKGIDPNKCGEAQCEVEYGRLLGADKIVTSSLLLVGGTYYFQMRLYDCRSATMENQVSRKCQECNFDKLIDVTQEAAQELFGGILEMGGSTLIIPDVNVEIITEPEGALVEIGGNPVCETPCTRVLKRGRYNIAMKKDGYIPYEGGLNVVSGMPPLMVKLEKDAGFITVITEPAGLNVNIDGKSAGESPIVDYEIKPGNHEISIIDASGLYREEKKVVEIKRGGKKELRLKPTMREGDIKVYAFDKDGKSVPAEVYINRKEVGKTPGTFRVPVGEHRVEVNYGGKSFSEIVRVKDKEVKEVKISIKAQRESGFFIYPTVNYSFSSISGLNYGLGLGYRIGFPFLFAPGVQWTAGELSQGERSIGNKFLEIYSMLGVGFTKGGNFGGYIKPSFNYEWLTGDRMNETGYGARIEAGLYLFKKPINLFTGAFTDLDMTGMAMGLGVYF